MSANNQLELVKWMLSHAKTKSLWNTALEIDRHVFTLVMYALVTENANESQYFPKHFLSKNWRGQLI